MYDKLSKPRQSFRITLYFLSSTTALGKCTCSGVSLMFQLILCTLVSLRVCFYATHFIELAPTHSLHKRRAREYLNIASPRLTFPDFARLSFLWQQHWDVYSAVGIVTSYGLEDPSLDSRQWKNITVFSETSRPALGSTQHSNQYLTFIPRLWGGKAARAWYWPLTTI